MPRKPRNYAAEYARRTAGTPKGSRERQIARGHGRSESHGFRPKEAQHLSKNVQQVGKPVKSLKEYGGGSTPRSGDIRRALARVPNGRIVIYVQMISSEDSPKRRKPGEKPERKIEWLSMVHDKAHVERIAAGDRTGAQVLSQLFQLERPVEAVLAWQIRPA